MTDNPRTPSPPCALNPEGKLKSASQIEFFHSPSDAAPLPHVAATPAGPAVEDTGPVITTPTEIVTSPVDMGTSPDKIDVDGSDAGRFLALSYAVQRAEKRAENRARWIVKMTKDGSPPPGKRGGKRANAPWPLTMASCAEPTRTTWSAAATSQSAKRAWVDENNEDDDGDDLEGDDLKGNDLEGDDAPFGGATKDGVREEDDDDEDDEQEYVRTKVMAEVDRQPCKCTYGRKDGAKDLKMIFIKEAGRVVDGVHVDGHWCTICQSLKNEAWFAGANSTLRTHVSRNADTHYAIYEEKCRKAGLEPHAHCKPKPSGESPNSTLDVFGFKLEPKAVAFSKESLLEHIIELIVEDDQAFQLVDRTPFRTLIKFLHPQIKDTDITHCTKVQEAILERVQGAVDAMRNKFKDVPGLISFTFDAWTSRAYDPYLAITAHHVRSDERDPTKWTLESNVVGFSPISGNHGGQNTARIITRCVDWYGLRGKIGWFTSDNASVNDVTVRCLGNKGMACESEDWDDRECRCRCGAHTINLAARSFIEAVCPTPGRYMRHKAGSKRGASALNFEDTSDDDEPATQTVAPGNGQEVAVEWDASDLLGKALAFVTQVRSSPQARAYFIECCEHEHLKPLQLVKWVRTRWSSMYRLVSHLIAMQAGVDMFTALADKSNKVPKLTKGRKYKMFEFTAEEWIFLTRIREVLQEPHDAQQSFSSQTVPTVWKAIPILEFLQTCWESMAGMPVFESLAHGLDVGLVTLRKYYEYTDRTSVNMMCLMLNPGFKMEYIKQNWDEEWTTNAEVLLTHVFDKYYHPPPNEAEVEDPITQASPKKCISGYAATWMAHTIRASAENKRKAAEPRAKLGVYLDTPTVIVEDIVAWWGLNSSEYPTLARIARDYLAVQGSAVPCECCFSSGGITGTDRRNRLTPETFEALQILKNAYKSGDFQGLCETQLVNLEDEVMLKVENDLFVVD